MVVVAMALPDGPVAYKKASSSGRLRRQLKGWFEFEYNDRHVEWSKLRTLNLNCMDVGRGSWTWTRRGRGRMAMGKLARKNQIQVVS